MKLKLTLAIGVVALLVLPLAASAGTTRDRVTGGGQILFSAQGAGNTVAFTAQQLQPGSNTAAKGEVQIVNRQTGVTEHGRVLCVIAQSTGPGMGIAEIAYQNRDTSDVDQLYVEDNGEPNQGNDVVFIDETPQSQCDFQNDNDDGSTALGRGNSQVYDGS